MASKHWGEMDSSDESLDEANTLADKIIEDIVTIEPAEIYIPLEEDQKISIYNDELKDSITLHTIKLIQYAGEIESLILTAQDLQNEDNIKKLKSMPPTPPIPEIPNGCILCHKQTKDLQELTSNSEFVSPPRLFFETVQKITVKAIAAIIAHAGFETTSDYILNLLADIVHHLLTSICQSLRRHVDEEALFNNADSLNVLDKTFYDLGLDNLKGLQSFYQRRIMKYHDDLLSKCAEQYEEYSKLCLCSRSVEQNQNNGLDCATNRRERSRDSESSLPDENDFFDHEISKVNWMQWSPNEHEGKNDLSLLSFLSSNDESECLDLTYPFEASKRSSKK